MDKKTKKIITIVSVVMIVIAVGIVLSRSVPPTTSTEGINSFEDTTVDGLRFSNIKMVGNQLTALVQNTLSSKTSIKSITVKFYDKNNNEIDSVDAYMGSKLEANEMKSLDVKTDADLSNLGNISYEVNRSSCTVNYKGGTYKQINGSGTYYYTGTYACNGVTGNLQSCTVTSVTKVNGWYNINDTPKYYDINGLTPRCFSACTARGDKSLASTLGASCRYWGDFIPYDGTGGALPTTISCSCDE